MCGCHTCSSFMAPLAHFIKQKGAKTEDPGTFDSMDPWMFWPYLKKRRLPFWLSEHWRSYICVALNCHSPQPLLLSLPGLAGTRMWWCGGSSFDECGKFKVYPQWVRWTPDSCVRVTRPTNARGLGSIHTCLDKRGHELWMNSGWQLKELGTNSPHSTICLCGRISCTTPHERFLVTLLLGWDLDFNSASRLANSRRLQRSVHVSNLCLLHLLNRHITQDAGDKIMDLKLYLANGW